MQFPNIKKNVVSVGVWMSNWL